MLTDEIIKAFGPIGAIMVILMVIWWRAYVGKVDSTPIAGLTSDDKLWMMIEVRDHICRQIDSAGR